MLEQRNNMRDFLSGILGLIFLELFIWVNLFISVAISGTVYFFLKDLGVESAGVTLIIFLISFVGIFILKNAIYNKIKQKKEFKN
ncbi:hypothetical protein [Providencia rettgeri]|uniref:hypothetical protein n=1 Tax=Providencia rettgeri TaxID=587 RepID=UPI001B3905B4|nr:hypothetical protein [Providencia rettgeri]MBQ0372946.1 hypothetical protein [Providencia rettgeri]